MKQGKGTILIVSLWVLTILSLLAVGLAYRVGLELHMTRYAQDRLKVFYIARAGLARATALLEEDSASNAMDTLQEDWHQNPSLFKEAEVGEGFFTIRYSSPDSEGEEEIRYGMEDEESRVPLNVAKKEVLERIAGLEEEGVVSIRAWRGDQDLSPEAIAREDDYYASLERPYPRKGKPFETLEELLLVKGITPTLFEEILPFFTVYGSGKVNLNTASAEILALLGLDETIAARLAEARRGEDGIAGTEDDNVFEAVSELVSPKWVDLLRLDQDQELLLTNFLTAQQALLSVQSTAFRIQVEARLRNGNVRKRIVAIVHRTEGKSTIQYWHED